ncbi:cation:proton antiporter [Corynebacterium phocae]|uniref:Cation:proton antiporter n=1 Tax=Corynebacterium phocae TaxID=161895 RepID=A0A1L7D2I6_9CORY|nr:monovalent cation/H+ antiporter subunit E [Corynebacterium phocae]APT92293.1 cation:proton antiporter [Corynebacterium phocae]KAA8725327.1 monovalent cation/H+ antiporter subunit E [Corynebacterium phocae]
MKATTALTYFPWLVKEIFSAGFALSATAFQRDNEYHPVILRYPLRVTSAWDIFWFTSSITATPGTLSVGLREPTHENMPRIILVQAVQGNDPKAIMEDLADMEERIAPEVAEIDYGIPGQGDHDELAHEFYEYPLETVGRQLRAPDMVQSEDMLLPASEAIKSSPFKRKAKK